MIEQHQEPLVSIITVCLNSSKTIRKTIESVLCQTYKNYEYLIIDGQSSDNTIEIIKEYEPMFEGRMKWISEPDKGLYDAMNKGIRLSRGQWIHILNSDDCYISEDALEKVLPFLKEEYVNYMTMFRGFDKKDILYSFRPSKWKLYYSAYLPHPTLVVHKSQYDSVGDYNISYRIAADHDLILRLVKQYPMNFINIPFVRMFMGGLSSTNIELSFKEFKDVVIKYGLPKWIASLLFHFKLIKYKMLVSKKKY